MNNKNKIVWIILLLFTFITVFISGKKYVLFLMLLLADVKLFLVAFQFMELKKAHPFWKGSLILLITIITIVLFFLVNTTSL